MPPHPVVIFFQMTTGWPAHPVVKFFSDDNRIGVSFSSHFQIKTMIRWNSSDSHSPNWKWINFLIWTMRIGWVSSDYHFDLEMRTGWHPYPVVIWKKINNRMCRPSGFQFFFKWQPDGASSGSHIRAIVVLKFFIRVQDERIRVQEELIWSSAT